jgi:hypothetical protein
VVRAAWQQERIAALQTQLDRVANGALLRVVNRLKRRG